jgi:hypothetical protein
MFFLFHALLKSYQYIILTYLLKGPDNVLHFLACYLGICIFVMGKNY